MERITLLEEQVVETTSATTKCFCQLRIPKYHNGRINQFSTCHILQPSKLKLAYSHQSVIIQSSPTNQSITCANVLRKIYQHGNGAPISIAC